MATAMANYRAAIDDARLFLQGIGPGDITVLLFHGDADGCCSGAVMYRTLHQMGHDLVFVAFTDKAETIYSDALRKRILVRNPTRLIVMDTGSRPREIVPGLRTLVIDHHDFEEPPPVEAFVSSHGVDPSAPAALVTYEVCREFAPFAGIDWLAGLGAGADLGVDAEIETVRETRSRYGAAAMREAISLVNAARRAPAHDVATAFSGLLHADSPCDIADGNIPEFDTLRRYRDEANAEVRRVMTTGPRISGRWAVIRFRSPALVHPLIALAWTKRLADKIVIAANYGYSEGNVHFSVRSARDLDLREAILGVRPAGVGTEFGHGHARATGGIVPVAEFKRLLSALGYSPEIAEADL